MSCVLHITQDFKPTLYRFFIARIVASEATSLNRSNGDDAEKINRFPWIYLKQIKWFSIVWCKNKTLHNLKRNTNVNIISQIDTSFRTKTEKKDKRQIIRKTNKNLEDSCRKKNNGNLCSVLEQHYIVKPVQTSWTFKANLK